MAFLLDTLAEKFSGEEGDSDGFGDMNYIVGNTSGMDIGEVPSPLDQRIGRMSQIGGSLMEVQITNPATFQIDRPELINVISQLDLDLTFHGDPNIGFTAAYRTRGQGVTGYNIVHRYFKRYLEQLASFKYEIEQRQEAGEIDDFRVGYVNMHASNEMIPPREERLASDVAVDPFGLSITNINDDKTPNIYKNENFLEKLFEYFFLEVVEQPWRQYEGIFSDIDDDFREKWTKKKGETAKEVYGQRATTFDDRAALLQIAANVDQGLDTYFLEKVEDWPLENPVKIGGDEEEEPVTAETLGEVADATSVPMGRGYFNSPRQLMRDVYNIKDEISSSAHQTVKNALSDLIDQMWEEEDAISVEGKIRSLARHYDIQQSSILEEAEEDVHDAAKKAFSKPENHRILENLVRGRYRDDFNKESSIFFHILPAWMQHADEQYENHEGWRGPKFLWENIVETEDGDPYWDSWDEFEEFLNERRENELNVIAAVGACFIWGHFTQVDNEFEQAVFDTDSIDDLPELKEGEKGDYTWIEWMNKFGLKLNIEAMFGGPGELRRVWRPKDIAITCHAINQTAERESEEWAESYEGPPAKFTIDMEHTSSYGVDPLREVELLIDQEESMAEEGAVEGDPDKPLANIVKTYHLTKPGWEQQQGHRHGPFARGDTTLYKWLYNLVDAGFARNEDDPGIVMFEVGGEYREEMYVIKVAMDMIQRGIEPDDLDPNKVPVSGDFENVEQELIARFFGLDKPNVNREWAKIEEHAFDPLKGLLEAQEFDYTWSSQAAVEQGGNRPNEWKGEEYK
ncbi:MAG: hypothetical protein ABEI58_03590 [Candidatus Nanohaloarchaea archaeon]